jgi:RNA polymerase sigma-70 factor (ECF subfamily)
MPAPEPRPDADLEAFVERLAARDELTWKLFVDQYAPLIYAYLRRAFGCDHAAAEDVAAECLRRILMSIPRFSYKTPVQFKAWVFAVVRNAGIDHARRRHPECPLTDDMQIPLCRLLTPEKEAELICAIREALDRLSRNARQTITLLYFAGLSPEAASSRLGISYGAFRVRLHRALKQLEVILRSDPRIQSRLYRT